MGGEEASKVGPGLCKKQSCDRKFGPVDGKVFKLADDVFMLAVEAAWKINECSQVLGTVLFM